MGFEEVKKEKQKIEEDFKTILGEFEKKYGMIVEDIEVNPVRNSSGALNPAGILLKRNPAAEQRGIISNGVKRVYEIGRDSKSLSVTLSLKLK